MPITPDRPKRKVVTESGGSARTIALLAALSFALAGAFLLARFRAWHAPDPPPGQEIVLIDDFEGYADEPALRARWGGGSAPGAPALPRLEHAMALGGRSALGARIDAGDRGAWRPLRLETGGGTVPANWSGHETLACMTRSLGAGEDGHPAAAPGHVHDLGDYLFVEVEAPDAHSGLWRRAALRAERNRRYLSWSSWSRWQVDLRGDPDARGLDWRRVRALRVAAAGSSPMPVFIYLDHCRLESRYRPVQDAEYTFLGVNMWDLWGRGDGPFKGMDLRRPFDDALRRDIREKLSYLAGKRIPILRIFLDYHLEIDPGRGVFEDDVLRRIDFVIDTIRGEGWPMRLLISLSTGYDLQTGISWYTRQVEGDTYAKVRAFYVDPALREIYTKQILHVLDHVNPSSGLPWKEEPVIWGWDVSNEPRILYGTPGTSYASRTREMVAWYAQMSGVIRSFDTRHRIVSGTFYSGNGIEPHDSDYDDWNIWELFTLDTIDALSVQSYVGPHLLRTGPKPLILEEFGYGGAYFEDPTDEKRAENYRWMLLDGDKVYPSGVGALLWQMNWNHGYADGKEIHSSPPSMEFQFSPKLRNSSLDLFEFYLAKYNRLTVEPEVEEGWGHFGDLRWRHRSIQGPVVVVESERFGDGYVTTVDAGKGRGLRALYDRLRLMLGAQGRLENRIFIPRTGRYRLEARARGPADRSGLLEVRIDGDPPRRITVPAAGAAAQWHRVTLEEPITLRHGAHVIRIDLCTEGIALDRYRLIPLEPA
ncbi:MAG: hypothetical protein Q8R92_01600 [Deltaproteobacteria bacterium]|nr:hypothetical protein [Deltaproteobacteria bacterium]